MTVSTSDTKKITFRGSEPEHIQCKIDIDTKTIVQINNFNFIENNIAFDRDRDIDIKIPDVLDYPQSVKESSTE